MPTEQFELVEVLPSESSRVDYYRTLKGPRGYKSLTTASLKDFLSNFCGWTYTGGPSASATTFILVSALPVSTVRNESVPLRTVDCATHAAAITWSQPGVPVERIIYYDPGTEEEPGCPHFALASTHAGTYFRWLAAMAALTGGSYTETALGDYVQVTFIAGTDGPAMNGVSFGGWAGGEFWGGGYTVASGVYTIEEGTPGTRIFLSFSEVAPNFRGNLRFGVRLAEWSDDAPPQFTPELTGALTMPALGTASPVLRVTGCPYQVSLYQAGTFDNALLVSMPWVPEGFEGYRHCGIVAAAPFDVDSYRKTFQWAGSTIIWGGPFAPAAAQWTGASKRITIPLMGLRMDTYYQTPDKLTTGQGLIVTENAYICSDIQTGEYISDRRLIGKLWNCCVLHRNYDPIHILNTRISGSDWVLVSANHWSDDYPAEFNYGVQQGTLWWKAHLRGTVEDE